MKYGPDGAGHMIITGYDENGTNKNEELPQVHKYCESAAAPFRVLDKAAQKPHPGRS